MIPLLNKKKHYLLYKRWALSIGYAPECPLLRKQAVAVTSGN
jgi:hypothetical protein